jgi:hypothetical protein
LLAGPDAVVTAGAACRWYGLRNAPGTQIEVLVPMRQARRQVGFVQVLRTDRPVHATTGTDVVRFAPVARSVADACRRLRHPRDVKALVIEAVQTRKVGIEVLSDELHAGPRQHSAALRDAIAAAATGAWSAPEHDLYELCRASPVLPEPWLNPELRSSTGSRLPTPDLWLDDVGLAVQVHSERHHSSAEDWARTIRTDSALAEAGILRISVSPREITHDGAAVVARIEALYLTLRPSTRPRVTATRRNPT